MKVTTFFARRKECR